jgi:hypothetical protein
LPRLRRILALLFELEDDDGKIWLLIACLDQYGNSKFLYPMHPDKTLLDVSAGDPLTFKGKVRLTVRRLKPYRTSECKDENAYRGIVCGRDWEAGG